MKIWIQTKVYQKETEGQKGFITKLARVSDIWCKVSPL
jgi:hypothetical protein